MDSSASGVGDGAADSDGEVSVTDERVIFIGLPRDGQEGIPIKVQPASGAQHITVDDMFQVWAEQENLDAKDRFFAMIDGKVVDGEVVSVTDERVYFVPMLSAASPKKHKRDDDAADDDEQG